MCVLTFSIARASAASWLFDDRLQPPPPIATTNEHERARALPGDLGCDAHLGPSFLPGGGLHQGLPAVLDKRAGWEGRGHGCCRNEACVTTDWGGVGEAARDGGAFWWTSHGDARDEAACTEEAERTRGRRRRRPLLCRRLTPRKTRERPRRSAEENGRGKEQA